MKKALLLVFLATFSIIGSSCEKRDVDDALDRRPNENIKDAVEDLTRDKPNK